MRSQRTFGSLITDFSGRNWDDVAGRALMESLAFSNAGMNREGSYVNMSGLNSSAHSPRANLSQADLCGADLRYAELEEANLRHVNFSSARLDQANLKNADLRGADLRSANLTSAQMEGARVYGALFDDRTQLPFSKEDALRKGMIYLEVTPEPQTAEALAN